MSVVTRGVANALNSRGPSPSIWGDCPIADFEKYPGELGQHYFNDFHQTVVGGSTLVLGQPGGLTCYLESNDVAECAIQADNDGVILLSNEGTDADVSAITSGDNIAGRFKTPAAGGEPRKLWFEARIKPVTITNSDGGFFVGLAQPGEAKDAGGAMAAGGASLSDVDYIGFAQLSGDGDVLEFVYNEATSGTAQTDDAISTMVAATWYKMGFKVTLTKAGSMELRVYIDGVDLGDDYAVDLSATNANWPGATDMDILLAYVGESGVSAADGIYIDWIRCAEQFVV